MCKLACRLKQAHCLIPNLSVPQARRPDWGATPRPALHREYGFDGFICGQGTLGVFWSLFFRVFWATNPSKSCSTSYAIDSIHPSSNLTETRAVPNQAKNNVTSRVRLDEKYVARRALLKVVCQRLQFARVCEVFLQRDARLESNCPVRTPSQATNSMKRTLNQATNTTKQTLNRTTNNKKRQISSALQCLQCHPVIPQQNCWGTRTACTQCMYRHVPGPFG
jgi:hypothetical protein